MFMIQETNGFRTLNLLTLKFKRGSDEDQKKLLAGLMQNYKKEVYDLSLKLEHSSTESNNW